jgi:hypothetical protein
MFGHYQLRSVQTKQDLYTSPIFEDLSVTPLCITPHAT